MAFEWLDESLARLQEVTNELRINVWVDIFPPVPPETIDHWEKLIGTPFPKSYRDFYQKTNGLYLDYRADIAEENGDFIRSGNQFYFLKIEHILAITNIEKEWRDKAAIFNNITNGLWNNLILCCDVGDGNNIVLDPENRTDSGEYRVCDAEHECWPNTWRKDLVIAESFEDCVKKMLDTIIVHHAEPAFWPSQLSPFLSLEPLLPPGAEKYDWREIASVENGIIIPGGNEITHPLTYERMEPSVTSNISSTSDITSTIDIKSSRLISVSFWRSETPWDPNNANN